MSHIDDGSTHASQEEVGKSSIWGKCIAVIPIPEKVYYIVVYKTKNMDQKSYIVIDPL